MEPSLNIAYQEIESDLGVFFGFGAGSTYGDIAWTVQQQAQITKALKSGLRRFYYPEPLSGERDSHKWSFLRPTATLAIPAGGTVPVAQGVQVSQTPMPDDFGGVEGQITVVQTGPGTSAPWVLDFTNEGRIREMYSFCPTQTGPPQFASCVLLKGTSAEAANRAALLVFPLPDQEYFVQFQYYINPDYLSGAKPYAYGGAHHAETLREACLSAAESFFDDSSTGVHRDEFNRRLAASVAIDRRSNPIKIGYNRDFSDGVGNWYGRPNWLVGGIEYNGIQY